MKTPLRVLIAEDDPADAELVLRELRRAGFEPEWHRVQSEAEFLERLQPGLDIVLSDFQMPQFSGIRALDLWNESGLDIPFIIISGTIGEDIAVDVMKRGASDYMMKDRLMRLGPAIEHALHEGQLRRERKEAEEALLQSEAEFRAMNEASPLGIFVTDCDGKSTYANATLRQMLGVTFPQMAGCGWTDYVHPLDRAELVANWQKAVASRQAFEGGARWVRSDGTTIHANVKTAVMREGDRVRGYVGVMEDITDRKLAEEALRKSEERTRLLVQSSNIGLWDWNLVTNEVFLSPEWKGQLGYADAEVQNRYEEWEGRLHPEDREATLAAVTDYGEGRRANFDVEFRMRHKDGSWRWILARATITRDATGKPMHIMGCHIDITERKRIEGRFRRLVDSDAQGVVFFKTSGEITGGNDAFLHSVGYSREDLEPGRLNWIAMTPPEYTDLDRHCLEELAVRGVCAPYEKAYLRKDGSRVPVLISAAAFEDNAEEGVCFIVDLTERKKLEQQFLRAQRMESIGTLAGGIAHDLNNILAPIMMSVPLLRCDMTAEQREAIIATIEMSADRGAQIVRQVLTFGRGLEGERHPLPLGTLINEVVKIARQTFPKDIAVESTEGRGLWPVLGDATQMHQILLNLCINARDAMPEGGKLRLSTRNLLLDANYASMMPGTTAGPYVLLKVSDTGSGMPPEVIERIFDPFFTTKGIGEGTGLGLSTVLGIVKSHGGHIAVTSTPGQGTTFEIYLPASKDHEGVPDSSAPAAGLPHGHGECVLVVDDEEPVRDAVRNVLEMHGYRVLLATDGTDALAVFAKNAADIALVLTDLMMPHMDGVALIRALRKMQPGMPLMASTGLGDRTRVAELKTMNIEAILNKPYDAGTLLHAVHGVLHRPGKCRRNPGDGSTSMKKKVRILIADDHEIVRRGIRPLLETEWGWEIVGEAINGRQAVSMALELKPDVVIVDVSMPELGGVEVTRQIRRDLPETEVLVFTGQESEALVHQLLAAGARGFVLKNEAAQHLIPAIKALCGHQPFFGSRVTGIVFDQYLKGAVSPGQAAPDGLTPREREIVQLLAEGKSNKEVGAVLGISVKTAETHRAAVMRKLGFGAFSELVRYAVRNHIVQP